MNGSFPSLRGQPRVKPDCFVDRVADDRDSGSLLRRIRRLPESRIAASEPNDFDLSRKGRIRAGFNLLNFYSANRRKEWVGKCDARLRQASGLGRTLSDAA